VNQDLSPNELVTVARAGPVWWLKRSCTCQLGYSKFLFEQGALPIPAIGSVKVRVRKATPENASVLVEEKKGRLKVLYFLYSDRRARIQACPDHRDPT